MGRSLKVGVPLIGSSSKGVSFYIGGPKQGPSSREAHMF